ncbi:MAG: CDP-glycerol glycerophosphotransferase family protein [Treponema sp.]|nr:CDP-glycerol glycerophosphotransferase family protein [Treponema sp.]
MTLLPLYIDPGTGSMLFSILIAAVATISFGARALWIKLRVVFSGKKAGNLSKDLDSKPYVIYNEGNQYWNNFKPVCDEFEKRKIELTYYTSAKNDPCFEMNYEFVKPEFIGEGNIAFAKLNMLSAGFVLMTTPGLHVYQLKRSKKVKHYSHILHAPSDATLYRLFGLDFFDSVLLSGNHQIEDIRYLEKQRGIKEKDLVIVGCPYLDTLKEKINKIEPEINHTFTVLVSPSWGASALLTKYGEKLLDPLVSTGWNIIVRPHPQSKKSESEMLNRLTEKYKDYKNLVWDYERDNIYSMKKADIMISDFSGIIFDYTFLCEKPVMYVSANMDLKPYDAYDLPDEGKNIWSFRILSEIGIELQEKQFGNIKEIIQNISDNKELSEKRRKIKQEAWMNEGLAGKLVADYMISTINC